MNLGRKTRALYKKNPVKAIRVKANIPAATATKLLILGQHGIQAEPFITAFNAQTKNRYREGIILPTNITISTTKQCEIGIKPPTTYLLANLCHKFAKNAKRFLANETSWLRKPLCLTAYRIAMVQQNTQNIKKNVIRTFIGTLRSLQLYRADRLLKKQFNYKKKNKNL